MTEPVTRKVSAHPNIGTLQPGDKILGERTSGTTGLFTVGSLGGAVDSVNGLTGAVTLTQDTVTDGTTYKQYSSTEKTKLAAISGTNTGDQTSIVGITGTMAQFDTAVLDGNIVYQSQALGTPTSGTLTNCTGLPVAGGGTGIAATTPYSVICAGTTATGAFQSLASLGTAGQKLISNGAGTLPSMQSAAGYFYANRTTAQTISTGTYTKMQLDTEVSDVDNAYDNATNFRHTPTKAGKWLYISCVSISNIADTKAVINSIYKNGSNVLETVVFSPATASPWVQQATILDMNGSTDYVELYIWHNHGSSIDTQATNKVNYLLGVLL